MQVFTGKRGSDSVQIQEVPGLHVWTTSTIATMPIYMNVLVLFMGGHVTE